jgi:hypothetical protein
MKKYFWLLIAFALFASQRNATSGALHINNLEQAKGAAIGTWTESIPLTVNEMNSFDLETTKFWIKIIVRGDGSCSYFLANPADNNWGHSNKCKWKMDTGKYENTGERYFGIMLKVSSDEEWDDRSELIFDDANTLHNHAWGNAVLWGRILTKGNRFPFSK